MTTIYCDSCQQESLPAKRLLESLKALYAYAQASHLPFEAGWGESVRRRVEETLSEHDPNIQEMLKKATITDQWQKVCQECGRDLDDDEGRLCRECYEYSI